MPWVRDGSAGVQQGVCAGRMWLCVYTCVCVCVPCVGGWGGGREAVPTCGAKWL